MKCGAATTARERLAEAAIAAVPDWDGATIDYRDMTAPVMSPMHKNVDSLCFAVDVYAAPYFMKIVHPEFRMDSDVPATFAAAQSAASLGVAPRALHCLAAHHAIVFDRLGSGWRTAKSDDLRAPELMAAVIAAKKKIHAGAALGRSWTVFDGIRAISLRACESRAVDCASVLWMIKAAHDIEAAFEAAGFDTAPCHADGLASNVMIGEGGDVRLVDFDMACDTDPLYDLGIVLNEAYAFDEELGLALEVYEGHVRSATRDRCRLYGIADDLYWGLWASQMHATSCRRAIEFLKYSQWRLLRCSMAMQDPDFERKLRMI